MSVKSPLPRRLKEARTRAGLSQKQLGIKAGIDEFSASARMNQYERGTHTPDFGTLKKISLVVNVPTAFFYAEEDTIAKMISSFVGKELPASLDKKK